MMVMKNAKKRRTSKDNHPKAPLRVPEYAPSQQHFSNIQRVSAPSPAQRSCEFIQLVVGSFTDDFS